ncbi:MAG: glycosyltransferase family 4 protein [Actinobacteria bacterium]|nr:glycosyltransferase family 4 protein [Actinomycetota bacterium]MBU1494221.1 glycosyltransferase family 4 protein [Actinomycetota bacterium]MBU1866375.1 glycosyltransferase family 4 protein [Actinomycetota bacterium]
MRIGFVSMWANRGQGIITRQIREIFDRAGHETFVLARPVQSISPLPNRIDRRSEWQEPGVTVATSYQIPGAEYLEWAKRTGIEVLLADQNAQFAEIAALRAAGVRTIGRFVWERFGETHVEGALEAFDTIYSVTRAEQARYRDLFGIDSPYVRYGIHPTLIERSAPKRHGPITFIFHGGLQGARKPIAATVEAFKRVDRGDIRLIVKSQAVKEVSEEVAVLDDPRIEHVVADMAFDEYVEFYSSCHVCLTPTRWEGLGVWIFESLAFGMPVISSAIAPVAEVIRHGINGLLARSTEIGMKKRGVPVWEPDVGHLSELIAELADPGRLGAMTRTLVADRPRLSWDHTRDDYLDLVERRRR